MRISIFGESFGAAAKVAVNGKAIPVEYAGPNQINLDLPATVNIGTNHLTVTADGTTGPEVNFWVTEAMPAIYVAVNAADSTQNLTAHLTGIGPVDKTPPWSATVGGRLAGKLFLGLAPSLVGVYQANISVPPDLSPGDYPLTFTVNGVTSLSTTISVGN